MARCGSSSWRRFRARQTPASYNSIDRLVNPFISPLFTVLQCSQRESDKSAVSLRSFSNFCICDEYPVQLLTLSARAAPSHQRLVSLCRTSFQQPTTKMEDPLVPATNGAAIGRPVSPAPPAISTIDPQLIISYLESVLHVTLGASREELQANNSFLSQENLPDTLARCQRFASEAQVAIYVQQEALDAADGIQGDGDARK